MPSVPTPARPAPALRHERWLLLAILCAAAFVRLWRLDLMEFKYDEAEACRLAYHVLGDQLPDGANHVPLTGLRASVGLPNPPLFVYALALPLSLSRSPYAAVIFIALCNVVAVWLCYWAGRRFFSPFVGLTAAALYALSPWAIAYSRKIWAQDLMPVIVCLFLLLAHEFLVLKKPRALAGLILLAAAAIQLHFSALILLGVLGFILLTGRPAFHWRWFACGTAAALLLYAPYFYHFAATQGSDFAALREYRQAWVGRMPAGERLLLAIRYTFAVSNADEFAYLTGTSWRLFFPLSLVSGLATITALVRACLRARTQTVFPARLMLAVWFGLPALGLFVTGIQPSPHYFIILYPLPFLGLALALEKLEDWRRPVGGTVLAALLACYAAFDVVTFRALDARGGAPADYGVAYTHKSAAVDFVLAENRQAPLHLFSNFDSSASASLEYTLLTWLKLRAPAAPLLAAKPVRAFVIIDRFARSLSSKGETATRDLRRAQFGPLTVFIVPIAP
jgi:4-amino-4-deoxy-L-arabinose transferase-like glycosyltransferase